MANSRIEREQNKPERIPVSGLRDIMTVLNKDPNFEYRFVLDKDESGSRIMRFKRGWWEFARADDFEGGVSVGQESVYKSKQDGSIVRFPSGEGHFSYLMKIPKKFYDEDQAAKMAAIDEVESAITRTGNPEGDDSEQLYGTVKMTRT